MLLTLVIGFTLTANETQAASKKVSLKISNGGTYYGEVKDGKPHGKGTARWGENKTYSGDWVNGKRAGEGKYIFKDTSDPVAVITNTYTGTWKNDNQNGKGLFTSELDSSDGNTIPVLAINSGEFKNNKFIEGYSLLSATKWDTTVGYTDAKKTIWIQVEHAYGDWLWNMNSISEVVKDNGQVSSYSLLDKNKIGFEYLINGSEFQGSSGIVVKKIVNGLHDPSKDKRIVKANERANILKNLRKDLEPHLKGLDQIIKVYKNAIGIPDLSNVF